jgi:hypothetical protein
MMRYREFDVKAPEYQPMAYFSSDCRRGSCRLAEQHPRHYSTDAVPRPTPVEG